MIAAWHPWIADIRRPDQAIIDALGGFGGTFVRSEAGKTGFFAEALTRTEALAPSAPCSAVLHGWIDNGTILARDFGLENASPAALYAAALERWGEEADNHLSGNYAAIARLPGGALRLSRSAWDAPPLYFAQDERRVIASPLLRVLFASGVAKEVDYNGLIDQLAAAGNHGSIDTCYKNIARVSLGHAVTINHQSVTQRKWYDLTAIKPVRFARDEDYVEGARELLDDAAREAVRSVKKPALALSGGLDSPLAATALLDALPPNTPLDTITFTPDPDWDGRTMAGVMGDESLLVKKFAEMYPRIHPHFADPAQGGFAYKSREMASAMLYFAPGLANMGMYHGVFSKAKALGVDWLLNADLANQSFSNDGRWAYVEYARKGNWRELVSLLKNRPGDNRSLLRKMLSLSVLPQLPTGVQNRIRGAFHPPRRDMLALLTPLSKAALLSHRERARLQDRTAGLNNYSTPSSRIETACADHAGEDGAGADIGLAFEQLYGVRRRDITAYRPLIEFCVGMPTRQFASGGKERRLARRMAKGRLPENQRLNSNYGQHNIDWIARMGRERKAMIAACETMRGHPVLSEILDIDRITGLLQDWPKHQAFDIDREWPRMFAIPQAILAAQFIGIAEGSNEL